MSYPDRLLLRGACALLGDELRFEPAPLDVLIEREYRGLADRYAAAEASSAPVIEAVGNRRGDPEILAAYNRQAEADFARFLPHQQFHHQR